MMETMTKVQKPVVKKRTTADIPNVLQDAYDSEINLTMWWFWDGGISIEIGDDLNGLKKAGNFDTVQGALHWLVVTIPALYPESEFSKMWSGVIDEL